MAEEANNNEAVLKDVLKALEKHKVKPNTPHDGHIAALAPVFKIMGKANNPRYISFLVRERCPLFNVSNEISLNLERGLIEKCALLESKIYPDLRLYFSDASWSEYYNGNNKYPPVTDLRCLPKDAGLTEKMRLFYMIMSERQALCGFARPDLSGLNGVDPTKPVIIIPSGGKKGDALGIISNGTWWSKMKKDATVIFVVSNDDVENYHPLKANGVILVSYKGFGIGRGRAVGVQIAKKLNRICFMTDDRVKDLLFNGISITAEQMMGCFPEPETMPWISGVPIRVAYSVMTVINPLSNSPLKPTFSSYFLFSKEDLSLYHYSQTLSELEGKPDLVGLCGDLQVEFDSNNPNYDYKDKPDGVVGQQDQIILGILNSELYVGGRGVRKWSSFEKDGFESFRNAIKIQEAGMFQLLQDIFHAMLSEGREDKKLRTQFDEDITPWFS